MLMSRTPHSRLLPQANDLAGGGTEKNPALRHCQPVPERRADRGPEKPEPQVKIIGAQADLVYDDDAKKIKLTNFRP